MHDQVLGDALASGQLEHPQESGPEGRPFLVLYFVAALRGGEGCAAAEDGTAAAKIPFTAAVSSAGLLG